METQIAAIIVALVGFGVYIYLQWRLIEYIVTPKHYESKEIKSVWETGLYYRPSCIAEEKWMKEQGEI